MRLHPCLLHRLRCVPVSMSGGHKRVGYGVGYGESVLLRLLLLVLLVRMW